MQVINEKIKKIVRFYKSEGPIFTVKKIFTSLLSIAYTRKYRQFVKTLGNHNNASIFSEIYKKNLWRSGESHSGLGSELAYTKNLIKFLPLVFEKFNIKTFIDAPCGDFNWMKHVSLRDDMFYIGMDIVPDLVASNQKKYSNNQHQFILADISKTPFPKADLLFCRDCLFHLSNKDICFVFKNFLESDIPLLLTTTHINTNNFSNTNIHTGDFRLLDLFSEPFCLPRDVHYRIEDFVVPFPPREMCLWDKEQVRSAIPVMEKMILNP
jgi:hypothetical protein